MQQLRLVSLSAVLALLIWVVADYSLTDTAKLQLRLEPNAASHDMRVIVDDLTLLNCEAVVTGKRAVVNALRVKQPILATISVGVRSSGNTQLDLVESLRHTSGDLAQVIVQEVDPPTLPVRVDRDKTVMMPLEVRPGSLEYEGPIVVKTTDTRVPISEVTVTISELEYEQLAPEDRRVVLNLDNLLGTSQRGVPSEDIVPLPNIVGGYTVHLNPDAVLIEYQLAEQLQEMTISAVPIKIEASPDIFNSYRVEVRDAGTILTQPVTIRARAEVLDRVRNDDDYRITGVIELTAADKDTSGQYREFTPRFNLPPGVKLASAPEPIEFRLVPVETEPATP
ncbi:MAG: hypothetical protein H6817_09165 [Phycisphaerales bacterium]|nr:hypothetical protein [Phycisphaerales bacterium]